MNYKEITPGLIKGLARYMESKFDMTFLEKDHSEFMKVVSSFVSSFTNISQDEFMENFATTVGSKAYFPFIIGVANDHWSLLDQLYCIVHEPQHRVIQNCTNFYVMKYNFSSSYRVKFEAECYYTKLEMAHFLGDDRTEHNIDQIINLLESYRLSTSDLKWARQYFADRAENIHCGKVSTKSSQYAIEWIKNNEQKYLV